MSVAAGRPNEQQHRDLLSDVTIRIANPADYSRIEAAYSEWGYRGGVAPEDVIYIAERRGKLIGAVRKTLEHGVPMLRGMYIAPAQQRRGIGSNLLRSFVADLHEVECYCAPYSHLLSFYAQAGFAPATGSEVPDFLRARAMAYRKSGLDVTVMRRAAACS